MKQNQSIEIQLVDAMGALLPLSEISIKLWFFTNGNYRYGFMIGRTNPAGHLSISYDDVENLRREDAAANLMDYNTELNECDAQVTILIPSEQQLREQLDSAKRFYRVPPQWAKSWPANGKIQAPLEVTITLNGDLTSVQIPTRLVG